MLTRGLEQGFVIAMRIPSVASGTRCWGMPLHYVSICRTVRALGANRSRDTNPSLRLVTRMASHTCSHVSLSSLAPATLQILLLALPCAPHQPPPSLPRCRISFRLVLLLAALLLRLLLPQPPASLFIFARVSTRILLLLLYILTQRLFEVEEGLFPLPTHGVLRVVLKLIPK